jgi:diguanylate cyclase (GGDEF)-like protein/PAS domain S-box-containing protein
MTDRVISCEADLQSEVASLIESMHKGARGLDQVAVGEMDPILDPNGRALMIPGTQVQERRREVVRQAAILDALPAQIALLDSAGVIRSVNSTWRTFSIANGGDPRFDPLGRDYLAICAQATGEEAFSARRAASEIRSVLSGKTASGSFEYRCDSPTQVLWFRFSATPLSPGQPGGAVIMHQDVTVQRKNQENLESSELRFRQMAETISDVFFLQSVDGTEVFYVSPGYERVYGRTCRSLYENPASWQAAIHPEDRDHAIAAFNAGRTTGADFEHRTITADGVVRWVGIRTFPIVDEAGNVYRIAGIAKDITERKESEVRILRLNRVYGMLSGINSLIVRVRSREELYRGACRFAVEVGKFKMAWVGAIDAQTHNGAVVARFGGDESFVEHTELTASGGTQLGEESVSFALRLRQSVICNDVEKDPAISETLRKQLLSRGHRAMASFPLTIENRSEAVFALFSGEAACFDAEESRLIAECTGNISYALDHLERVEQLHYVAFYDLLTGLANRRLFLERVSLYVSTAQIGGHKLALCLFDLERFKNINDVYGRPLGDELLKQVTRWLTNTSQNAMLLSRVGADIFGLVLPDVQHEEDVARLIEESVGAFMEHTFSVGAHSFRLAPRIGIALFPDDGVDAELLFANAEAALKKAKVGGDRYLFYAQKMTETVAGRLDLEFRLRMAVERQEFVLHYQPKVDLETGEIVGAEALIRWLDPLAGMVPPNQFVPILEETGMIFAVGRWALETAMTDYSKWHNAGLLTGRIAVNVSPLQLQNRAFLAEIQHAVRINEHAASGLELEITESMIMADISRSSATLQEIRSMGVKIAIDDFGTGFSSLGYLAKLPVDSLKIDRSFVADMHESAQGLTLVSTIVTMAHSLNLTVVAEGVETEQQARSLRSLGCDEMQGWLFSKALPADAFAALLLSKGRERSRSPA